MTSAKSVEKRRKKGRKDKVFVISFKKIYKVRKKARIPKNPRECQNIKSFVENVLFLKISRLFLKVRLAGRYAPKWARY